MRLKGQKEHYGRWIASIVFLLLLVTLYSFIIKTDNLLLEGIGLGITLILVFINFFYLIRAKVVITKETHSLKKENVDTISVSPLEAYFIHSLWYHKKNRIFEKQIVSEIFYELEKETILFDGEVFSLFPNIDMASIDSFEFRFLCGMFLTPVEFQQNEERRKKKMIKIQKEEKSFSRKAVKEYALENLSNRDTEYSFIEAIKEKYFVSLETANSALFTFLSGFLILLNMMSAFSFLLKETSLFNFYLPIMGAFLLVLGITSPLRERVRIQEGERENVNHILNYLKNLKKDFSSKDILYLQAISSVVDQKRMKILQIE